jgi:hypothetical protein
VLLGQSWFLVLQLVLVNFLRRCHQMILEGLQVLRLLGRLEHLVFRLGHLLHRDLGDRLDRLDHLRRLRQLLEPVQDLRLGLLLKKSRQFQKLDRL